MINMRDGITPSLIYFIFLHIDATNELKTSVSDGKTAIAAAVTDKGVNTAASDSFSTMASNIRSITGKGPIAVSYNYLSFTLINDTSFKITSDYFSGMKSLYDSGRRLQMSIPIHATYMGSDNFSSASGNDIISFLNGATSYSSSNLSYSFNVTFTYTIYDTYIVINISFPSGQAYCKISSIASARIEYRYWTPILVL